MPLVFKRTLLTLLFAIMAGSALAIDPQQFESPEQEQRFKNLIAELRCLVCQNQNLADSNAELAKDLRDEVLGLMQQGMSDEEIKSFLTERYSDFVLYRPPVNPTTYLLWFGPLVLVLGGGLVLWTILRRRSTMPMQSDPELTPPEEDDA